MAIQIDLDEDFNYEWRYYSAEEVILPVESKTDTYPMRLNVGTHNILEDRSVTIVRGKKEESAYAVVYDEDTLSFPAINGLTYNLTPSQSFIKYNRIEDFTGMSFQITLSGTSSLVVQPSLNPITGGLLCFVDRNTLDVLGTTIDVDIDRIDDSNGGITHMYDDKIFRKSNPVKIPSNSELIGGYRGPRGLPGESMVDIPDAILAAEIEEYLSQHGVSVQWAQGVW